MKRALEAAWWFLLGAVLMHVCSAFMLRPVLDAVAIDAKADFFVFGAVAIGALAIVGIIVGFRLLTRVLRRAN